MRVNMAEISLTHLHLMMHAIGFNRKEIKYNKYKAWRNYFQVSIVDEPWEQLVNLGLATKVERGDLGITYHVTDKGFELIEMLYQCKIIKD